MGIGLGLIYAATGALRGFEEKDRREREQEERDRSNRLRELQEMQYLTSLLNTPGVMAGGDTRVGMQQLGPAPEGLGKVPFAGGILEAGWNAARIGGAAAGPERDIIPLGTAGGQEIGFDPYMSEGAQGQRAAQAKAQESLLDKAYSELTNYEAYQELQRRGVRVGNYSEAVDYSEIVQRNVESGITEGRTSRGRIQADELTRGRTDERDSEKERIRMMKLDVRNRAFNTFHDDETATVGDFQKTLTPVELEQVDLPSLQTIWREARKVTKDPGPAELREGLKRALGKPGSRQWQAPGDSVMSILDPSLHQDILDMLTLPYKEKGRPLTVEEILKNFRGAFEAGELTEFELKTAEEILRPIPPDEDLFSVLQRLGYGG